MSGGLTYRDAGVDLEAARETKARLSDLVRRTRTDAVSSDFGSFGGRFRATPGRELVASADGVGTKLKIAFMADRHDTVGADLVNHCVNDILVEGARPLVFLDYVACGVLDPDTVISVVAGLAEACRENGCALLGGETAEMPDFYAEGEYDLAGFVVGEIAYPELARREIAAGDHLIGLASSGIHTNGYSFVRALFFGRLGLGAHDLFPGAEASVSEVLLRPHRSYLPILAPSLEAGRVRALAHITGGGIPGNLDRILDPDLDAVVRSDAWTRPHEFAVIARESGAEEAELFDTFNMGVGMIAVVRESDVGPVLDEVRGSGCDAFVCGELVEGAGKVRMEGA
ncbi:phosphoribosylformylglycinamidine cyclo-ligase [Candidatus Palauibacter sp.]|uniref:phosphoribosylformylglycinamidine cyclo-ligase n=1 Tax=Candidatus Palauibacter sp. TaxID=3101350 RepID=UPI003B5B32FD